MAKNNEYDYTFFVVPIVMAGFGYYFLKALVFDLVGEVWDHGQWLVVKNRSEEQRINLHEIINVSLSTFVNPTRMSMRLRTPGKMGIEITFIPASEFSFNPLRRPNIYEDLIARIDSARQS